MNNYGDDLFKGTATYYSKYRPMYPPTLIRFLIETFNLNGKGKMLDIGCGTGQLTVRFSDWFEKIVAIDTDPEMMLVAKRLCEELRVDNIEFFNTSLKNYQNRNHESFTLVTIAKAFHWLDREETLETLYELLPDQGGVAIIDHYSPNRELMPWQKTFNEIVRLWYGEDRRAGHSTYTHPTISHQEVVLGSPFVLEEYQLPSYEHVWSIDSMIGNHYSTSYGAHRFLGEKKDQFETHLREELLAIDATGVFKEEMSINVILALKNSNTSF